jgi:phosphopantetheinyl transferase
MASIFQYAEFRETTLFLFYVDLLDGSNSIDSSPSIAILKDDFKFELLLRNLDLKTQLKIRNIKNNLDRYVKLINLLMLKYIVYKYETELDINLDEIKEIRNKYGKPKLSNRSYQYNLSDEHGMVALGIGFNSDLKDTEIGVDLSNTKDIENFKLNKLEDFFKVDFRDIFNDNEIKKLSEYFKNLEYNDRLRLLSKIWALKESYCKYIGIGLTAGMQNFEFLNFENVLNVDQINEKINEFEIVAKDIEMKKISEYKPLNVCLGIPNTSIICSIFSDYQKVCVIKVNVEEIIKYFTQSR